MTRITPFPWYGSKYTQVNWIIRHLPETEQYVEPFGGSGVVLLNKEPVDVETYNDLNSSVVNFFDVIRERPNEFLLRLTRVPYSREMYERALHSDTGNEMKRALHFLIKAGQSFGSATGRGWARSIGTTRRGMAQRAAAWEYRKEQIEKTIDRVRRVQIENKDAIELIQDFDREECLFYCDPPYPPESRGDTGHYKHEYGEDCHKELATVLSNCDAYVAISGYRCELLDDLYSDWNRYSEGEKTLAGKDGGSREEVLWTNYDVKNI